ncbi:MAG: RecX family transcriptional regulator [Candidatus Eremiobacteraeota bacterium]|nr:RecX family transcriptional regulator [Candidatus Eremiobacteraeota bacterium]MCW5871670.1 RecX family transcriptional regulator [Candidatus Eremiobacteraeota bacterium]
MRSRSARSEIEWTAPRAFAKLLERLVRSELSSRDALAYLLGRGCPPELAEAALVACQQRHFVDDARLGGLLAEKGRRVGWSQRRLRQEEYRRGLPEGEPLDEALSCRQLAERWLERGLETEKVAARLQRRGFSYSVIRQALAELQTPSSHR